MQRWSQHRHQLRLIHEISITPLLDVVLVLLFVFMLAAPLFQDAQALQLPFAGGAAAAAAPKDVVTLSVDAAQTMQLAGRVVPMSALQNEVAAIVKNRPAVGVLVQVHRELPVQLLIDLMAVLKNAGVQKTSVATAARDTSTS
jgi:biopolymer transport protein ExbD